MLNSTEENEVYRHPNAAKQLAMFSDRIKTYEDAIAAGEDIFGLVCEDESDWWFGAILWWLNQRSDAKSKAAVFDATECF